MLGRIVSARHLEWWIHALALKHIPRSLTHIDHMNLWGTQCSFQQASKHDMLGRIVCAGCLGRWNNALALKLIQRRLLTGARIYVEKNKYPCSRHLWYAWQNSLWKFCRQNNALVLKQITMADALWPQESMQNRMLFLASICDTLGKIICKLVW